MASHELPPSAPPPSPDRVRLDRWLWAARFYKTRSLAAQAIDGGKVTVNAERARRARMVQLGDEVRLRTGPFEQAVTVLALSERRGSASIAAELYAETPASGVERERLAEQHRLMRLSTRYEGGRPTKRERRQIDELRRGSE